MQVGGQPFHAKLTSRQLVARYPVAPAVANADIRIVVRGELTRVLERRLKRSHLLNFLMMWAPFLVRRGRPCACLHLDAQLCIDFPHYDADRLADHQVELEELPQDQG